MMQAYIDGKLIVANATVMAIDPGYKNVGIAFRMAGMYTTCKVSTLDALVDFFTHHIDIVIIERFEANTISKYGLDTVEMVGGMRALCHYLNIPLIQHMPQFRRAFIDRAKEIMLENKIRDNRKGRDNHEMDALAHLLAWEYFGK